MKILFISLGCDKNLVDSEEMITLLTDAGHEMTDDESEAEAVIINTCCFIHDAREESIGTILEMAEQKTSGSVRYLIVTGCLAQQYQEEITKEIPEVDAVLGTASGGEILAALNAAASHRPFCAMLPLTARPQASEHRVLSTGGHYAYLKIAEGCGKHCTYCIIPKLRGDYRSTPLEELVRQARQLAEAGVKELILVAQETTLYGVDLYGRKSLHVLLEKLCAIDGIRWIRLLYCYPEEIYEELIQTMSREKKICHYLDMPIQHASDRILSRMGRKTSCQDLKDLIVRLRTQIPDIALRTTLITGFPGETQEDHEALYNFVDEMEFDRLGVFTYSQEDGTPAAAMPDQVPEEVKTARRDELMELAQEISLELGQRRIGQELTVMVEGRMTDEPAVAARSYQDAPGVDGLVFIQTQAPLATGDFVRVRITGALEYDLIGELVDEFTE